MHTALSFENKDKIDENKDFPADFIAEGVDQTWIFILYTRLRLWF
jgi:isoleucyl-tRNA synthetase